MPPLIAIRRWDDHVSRAASCVLLDGRLHNRAELLGDLGLEFQSTSDADLLAAGYQRWGTGLAEKLVGEFAFVVWDEPRRQMFAARDPLGVRTLFYHADDRRLAIATSVEQLLALGDFEPRLEERSIFDFLLDAPRFTTETFFQRVTRLLPGHWLLASEHRIEQQRYWRPRPRSVVHGDCFREFRSIFEQAVEARLDSETPLLAQLSGGLDSSAIVCVADAVYRRNGVARPPLVTASAVFPGLDCDETPYINAVARQVDFPSERWDGTAEQAWDGTLTTAADPWSAELGGQVEAIFTLAQRHRSGAILSGFGGDELLFERGIFRDLAAAGCWLQLVRESALAPRYSTQSGWYFFKDGLRGLVPEFARRRYQSFRERRRPPPPPPWLGPRLRELWMDTPPLQPSEPIRFGSRTQQFTWQRLTSGSMLQTLEAQNAQAARHRVEIRYPFLDVRLVDFVLGLPYESRVPGGQMKLLLRAALKDVLPAKIARRRRVTTFDANIHLQLRRIVPKLREVLASDDWASSAFLNKDQVEAILCTMDPGLRSRAPLDRLLEAWRLAKLELWLRAGPHCSFAARRAP